MSKPNGATVFALKSWTIKASSDGKAFFISPSVAFDDKPTWSKRYRSLQAACAAISRKLAEEWTARNARRQKFRRRTERTR